MNFLYILTTFGDAAQTINNIGQAIVALLIPLLVPFAMYEAFKVALKARAGFGRLMGNLETRRKGLSDRARERAQGTDYYQRRQLAKEAHKGERRRGNISSYAGIISNESNSRLGRLRAARLQQRAAGFGNKAGQQRVLQSAQDQIRKERHDEAERAAKDLAQRGFEGDTDFMAIARTRTGGTHTSARTGQSVQVNEAVRQAAVNQLVQQGRTNQIRQLETYDAATDTSANFDRTTGTYSGGTSRGAGGVATTDLHNLLDHAYEDYGSKLSDKAPDIMPSRRTTDGVAAFTDLKPEDVAKWHYSTAESARVFYNQPGRDTDRDQMLRAFSQATQSPTTRSQLSLDQVTRVRDILHDANASGTPANPAIANQIEATYTQLGGV